MVDNVPRNEDSIKAHNIVHTENILDEKHLLTEQDALRGVEWQHVATVRETLSAYLPGVLWCLVVSTGIIMESYDLQIIGSFFALPQFQQKYGVQLESGEYAMQASWQVALSLGSSLGIIVGIAANGWLVDRYGHRRLLQVSMISLIGFIFITFFAPNKEVLLVGEILCGFPWGICNTIAPSLAAEYVPMKLRGYMTTYVNLCWVIGHMIGAGVIQGMTGVQTEWAYRLPFALQWMWPLPLLVLFSFAPQSPWWLVRKGRLDEAEQALCSLSTRAAHGEVHQMLAMMQQTIQAETENEVGTTYRECFVGVNLRRTEIACIAWGSQALVGWCLQSYVTFFFEQAGLAPSDAFKLGLGSYCIAFVGTACSWPLQTYVGRRTIFMWGCTLMGALMFIIGFLAIPTPTPTLRWAQAGVLLTWFAVYGATVGPIPYVIAAEISAAKLRTKTIALSRDFYYILNVINSVISPYMINATEWNMKGKAAFPAAIMNTLLLIWAYFRLPEARGKTYGELDQLFEKHVPTGQFSKYHWRGEAGLVKEE